MKLTLTSGELEIVETMGEDYLPIEVLAERIKEILYVSGQSLNQISSKPRQIGTNLKKTKTLYNKALSQRLKKHGLTLTIK